MEYYHFVNIFETKGLEYLVVVVFLLTFVFFVRNLEKGKDRGSEQRTAASSRIGETIVVVDENGKH